MLWAWAGVPLGVYNISEGFNVALRVQPQILTALSLVTWVQCRHYQRVRLTLFLLSSPPSPLSPVLLLRGHSSISKTVLRNTRARTRRGRRG